MQFQKVWAFEKSLYFKAFFNLGVWSDHHRQSTCRTILFKSCKKQFFVGSTLSEIEICRKITTVKLRQNGAYRQFPPIAFYSILLTGATWYLHDIYMIFMLFTWYTWYLHIFHFTLAIKIHKYLLNKSLKKFGFFLRLGTEYCVKYNLRAKSNIWFNTQLPGGHLAGTAVITVLIVLTVSI